MSTTRLAVFDIDGTLTATNAVDDECFLRAAGEVLGLEPAGLDWSAAPHVTDVGIAGWLCERHHGRALTRGELARMTERFVSHLRGALAAEPARFAPVAGAVGVLDDLRDAGWMTALATGGWGASARLKLEAAHIVAVLAAPVAAGDIAFASSDDASTREEILRLALARAAERNGGASFGRVVSVGDGVWDVRTAAAVEWPFVGIARGAGAERLRAAGAGTVLPDLADRSALLHALDEARVPRAS
ncbi:MAG: HAD family hydrolase [Gemmatimonadaceae bacterium]